MPRVTFNRMSKKKSTVRRRRVSTTFRAKYAPKTTRVNRSLIKSNAYAIKSIRRLMPPPIYTDHQLTGAYGPFTSGAPSNYFNIFTVELMSPATWTDVLRKDANVEQASSTLVKRMQLNLRYSLGESNWCQLTTFVVSLRRDAANRIIDQNNLTEDEDYIYNGQNFNPRLNPAVFKVHYVRNLSLMANSWLLDKATITNQEVVGNQALTFAKGQVNMTLNYKIRQPLGTQWNTMNQDQMPPHQRLYLMSFFKGNTNEVDDIAPRVDYDALYTCFNAS